MPAFAKNRSKLQPPSSLDYRARHRPQLIEEVNIADPIFQSSQENRIKGFVEKKRKEVGLAVFSKALRIRPLLPYPFLERITKIRLEFLSSSVSSQHADNLTLSASTLLVSTLFSKFVHCTCRNLIQWIPTKKVK